ncbi:hypothetical protein FAIPA1_400035 [Frankia sp. AiPs1]
MCGRPAPGPGPSDARGRRQGRGKSDQAEQIQHPRWRTSASLGAASVAASDCSGCDSIVMRGPCAVPWPAGSKQHEINAKGWPEGRLRYWSKIRSMTAVVSVVPARSGGVRYRNCLNGWPAQSAPAPAAGALAVLPGAV